MVGMATLKAVKSLAIVITARPMATRANAVRLVSQPSPGAGRGDPSGSFRCTELFSVIPT